MCFRNLLITTTILNLVWMCTDNAIAFSINNNIALSLEIGSAYAMQVALLQIPVMVGFSVWMGLGRDTGGVDVTGVGEGTFKKVAWEAMEMRTDGVVDQKAKTVKPFEKWANAFQRRSSALASSRPIHPPTQALNIAHSTSTAFTATAHTAKEPAEPTEKKKLKPFTLIFPKWDIASILFAVFLLTFIYTEGKSDYFKGAVLSAVYLVSLASFWIEGS